MRTCSQCQTAKDDGEFYRYRYVHGVRFDSRCKSCARARRRARNAAIGKREAANCKAWRESNRAAHLEGLRTYRASDKGKAKRTELQRVREKKLNRAHLSPAERAQVDAIYLAAKELQRLIEVCPLFNDPLLGKEVHVDHVIALANGGAHHPSNLQPMLATFNRRKGAR